MIGSLSLHLIIFLVIQCNDRRWKSDFTWLSVLWATKLSKRANLWRILFFSFHFHFHLFPKKFEFWKLYLILQSRDSRELSHQGRSSKSSFPCHCNPKKEEEWNIKNKLLQKDQFIFLFSWPQTCLLLGNLLHLLRWDSLVQSCTQAGVPDIAHPFVYN